MPKPVNHPGGGDGEAGGQANTEETGHPPPHGSTPRPHAQQLVLSREGLKRVLPATAPIRGRHASPRAPSGHQTRLRPLWTGLGGQALRERAEADLWGQRCCTETFSPCRRGCGQSGPE